MSEARTKRRGVRPGFVVVSAAGALLGAVLFVATVGMKTSDYAESSAIALSTVAGLAAWGALFGGVATVVGLAGTPNRESAFGKALFVVIIGGIAMTVEIFLFGAIPWPDIGFGLLVLPYLMGGAFTLGMAVVCFVARRTFRPRTT